MSTSPSPHQPSVERTSWVEPYPTALCRDDKCPWKHVGLTLEATQLAGEGHVIESGHEVRVYRQMHRDLKREEERP